MISLEGIPNKIVLLFSGGPASTLLYWLLKDRDLTLCTVATMSHPAAKFDLIEQSVGVKPRVAVSQVSSDLRRGLRSAAETLESSGEFQGLVWGLTADIPALDPARRAREQGVVGSDFLYLTTTTNTLYRQGMNKPEGLISMQSPWRHEPLRDLNLGDLYQEYRRLDLLDLWSLTQTCRSEQPCLKCYDCRARQWAQTL